jgi:hypothetical protein
MPAGDASWVRSNNGRASRWAVDIPGPFPAEFIETDKCVAHILGIILEKGLAMLVNDLVPMVGLFEEGTCRSIPLQPTSYGRSC